MTEVTPKHGIGERCCLDDYKGTIRYVGEVPPTKGLWYGVEWDDERGKHDGTLNEVTYFKCRDKHGSFVRLHKVTFGMDTTVAIQQSYGEGVYNGDEIVINEKSSSEKVIEMVGFNKVALQQSDLFSLKEVDLANTSVSHANPEIPIEQICPNLNYLSLRKTLISSFNEVVKIAGNLKKLKVLNISKNKISTWKIEAENIQNTFNQLKSVYLNSVGINWEQLITILESIPTITEVHVCFNSGISDTISHQRIKELTILNLEGCSISSWDSIQRISKGSRLEWLILNNNQLKSIECQEENGGFPNLASLSLNDNHIEKWTSVNELNNIKSLKEIRFRNNPVCAELTSFQLRQELIGRLKTVEIFNGSKVDVSERKVAEIAYIKKYSNAFHSSKKEDGTLNACFTTEHPRYLQLIEVHGAPAVEKTSTIKLKENLLSITITCPDCDSKKPIVKKVPVTMTIQQLKGIIQRAFKVPNTKQKLSYLDKKNDREIELDDNMKQLSYYSLANDDMVYVRW